MNRIARIVCISLAIIVGAACGAFFYCKLPPSESPIHFQNLQIVHKAGSPENTLKAIKASYDQGAQAVELDVRLTKDNHLIAFHDETLDRMTNGSGKVSEYDLAQLKLLKIDTTESMPTLEEVAQLLIELDMKAELDIRNNPHHTIIAKKIDALFRSYNLYERVFVSSFNPRITYAIRSINPKIITGYGFIESVTDNSLIDFILRSSFIPKFLGVGIIEPHWRLLNPKMIGYWQKQGMLINAWTVNTKEQKDLIKKLGITTYVTNCFDAYCEEDLYDKDKYYGLSTGRHHNF